MDANMALWCVVPELRARGLMASMVSFFPFDMYNPKTGDPERKLDSLGIFVIGPATAIRMAFSPVVMGAQTDIDRTDKRKILVRKNGEE